MEKLDQHKWPRTIEQNHEANRKRIGKTAELICQDRSDRCTGSVWPVAAVQKLADRSCLPVWPVAPRKPSKTWIQTMNLNQTTTKIDETWGIASPLPREYIPKRSRPKDQRISRNRGEIKKDWGFLKNSRTSILKSRDRSDRSLAPVRPVQADQFCSFPDSLPICFVVSLARSFEAFCVGLAFQ